jgi:hypothetical protein
LVISVGAAFDTLPTLPDNFAGVPALFFCLIPISLPATPAILGGYLASLAESHAPTHHHPPAAVRPRGRKRPRARMAAHGATRPRGYLAWGKSHQLGTGLGLAIGAKVAAPDKFCVNFMGDAAFGMTSLDIETAVRAGIPSLSIVLNNNTMAIEIPHMKLSHEMHKSRALGGNFADTARSLGARSERVTDAEDVASRHPACQAGYRGRPPLSA